MEYTDAPTARILKCVNDGLDFALQDSQRNPHRKQLPEEHLQWGREQMKLWKNDCLELFNSRLHNPLRCWGARNRMVRRLKRERREQADREDGLDAYWGWCADELDAM